MFERYAEDTRRVLLFARLEASFYNATEISTKHLLLGVLRESPNLAAAVLDLPSGVQELLRRVTASEKAASGGHSPFVDPQLSLDSKRVLAYASEESEGLGHRAVSPVHLLLGLLLDASTSPFLAAYRLTREQVIENAESLFVQIPGPRGSRLRARALDLVRQVPEELLPKVEQMLETLVEQRSLNNSPGESTSK